MGKILFTTRCWFGRPLQSWETQPRCQWHLPWKIFYKWAKNTLLSYIYIIYIYIHIIYVFNMYVYIYIIYMCILYYYIISSIDRQTMKNIVDQRTSKCPRWWFPALAFRGTSSVRYLREVQDLSSGASCWGWSSLPKKSKKGREDTSLFSTFVCICIHLSCAFISIHFYPFLIFNKPGRNCNLNILKLQN